MNYQIDLLKVGLLNLEQVSFKLLFLVSGWKRESLLEDLIFINVKEKRVQSEIEPSSLV